MTPFQLGIFYAITTGLCWAVLAIALKYALHFASSGTIVWFRLFGAALGIFGYYVYRAIFVERSLSTLKRLFWPPPLNIVLAGLFLSFNYFGYMHGLELTSASNAQIMIQVGPLTLLVIGVFYFRESLRWQQGCGIALALVGFALFNWDQVALALEKSDVYIAGNTWIIMAALAWSVYATIQKRQIGKDGWTPQETNAVIYMTSMFALMPMARFHELAPLNFWQWLLMLSLGLNTIVAYGAFAEALQLVPASIVSLIISVNPLLTLLLIALIGHFGMTFISPEPIMWRGYLGAALVAGGVAIAVSMRQSPRKK